MKALEDLVVSYDNTVRNSKGEILQFIYGEDGFNPIYMENDNFPINLNRLVQFCKFN